MRNNLDRIGFQLSALDPDDIDAATSQVSQNRGSSRWPTCPT